MRIWIVGGGSIGLLLAADLAVSGCDVVLVVRTDEQARAIGGSGVTVRQVGRPDVRVRLRAFAFEEASAGAGAGKPDWIVPAVKQYDLDDRFVQVLGSWVTQHGRVCAIQNGLGHEQKLMKTIPPPSGCALRSRRLPRGGGRSPKSNGPEPASRGWGARIGPRIGTATTWRSRKPCGRRAGRVSRAVICGPACGTSWWSTV